ncbi:MAG: hypothetical protein ACKOYM_11315, partial [Actinomycetes bacterium]
DAEAEKIRARLATRIERLRGSIVTAEQKAAGARAAASDVKGTTTVDTAGSLLNLLGGRSRTRSMATAARKAMAGRERVNRANERADQAAAAVDAKVDDLEQLQAELDDQLVAIDDKWTTIAGDIDTATVALKKTDVSVRMLSLLWVPVNT